MSDMDLHLLDFQKGVQIKFFRISTLPITWKFKDLSKMLKRHMDIVVTNPTPKVYEVISVSFDFNTRVEFMYEARTNGFINV